MFSNVLNITGNVRRKIVEGSKRMSSSIFVWTIVMLVAVDLFISAFHPLDLYNNGHLIFFDQNVIAREFPKSLNQLPSGDACILGSSLPMSAVGCADRCFLGKSKKGQWLRRESPNCLYLQHLLSEKAGRPVTVLNLTCLGTMVSDVWLMTDRLVEEGRAPSVLLYGIAPRDFIDNTVPDAGKSHIFRTFKAFQPVWLSTDPQKVLSGILEGKLSTVWQFYNLRSDYHTFCGNLGNTWRQEILTALREDPVKTARHKHEAEAQEQSLTLEERRARQFTNDLISYKSRYNPPNKRRFEEELIYYKLLLSLCQRQGIKLFVFNMPLSNANRMLIDREMLQQYKSETQRIATEHGVRYVDLDLPAVFNRDDFIDSTHTCESGALKVHRLLVDNAGGLFGRVASR